MINIELERLDDLGMIISCMIYDINELPEVNRYIYDIRMKLKEQYETIYNLECSEMKSKRD